MTSYNFGTAMAVVFFESFLSMSVLDLSLGTHNLARGSCERHTHRCRNTGWQVPCAVDQHAVQGS